MAVRRLFLHRSVPWGLFVLVNALSIAASWYLSSSAASTADQQSRAAFDGGTAQIRRELQAGLNRYFEIVRAGGVLLAADNEIHAAEFRRFVDGLKLRERYPGLEGVGFARCVRARELRTLLRTMDLDGHRVRVWPAGGRADYCPTLFLEPSDERNEAAIGFDLRTDPALAEAMARARDLQQPIVSRRPPGSAGSTTGWSGDFVLLVPVYRTVEPLGTVELARRALIGFVFGPFSARRLLDDVIPAAAMPPLAFDVYDGDDASSGPLFGRSVELFEGARIRSSESVRVGGREWRLETMAGGVPAGVVPPAARQTLYGGLALSFALFLIMVAQVRAWEQAARHEAELQALAEALRESEGEARAANRAKDEFLATLSHELRTPLNVVLGWVSMLRQGVVREHRRGEALDIVERNARQQAALIDDLLDISRIVAGQLRLQLTPVAFAPILATVVESLRPSAEAREVTMSVHATGEPAAVHGDADRLRQIAWNLIWNAIKFTPPGGQVTVALTQTRQRVTLTVRDTGIGIPPEFLPHVFERFRQADSSTTRAHGGVGLGLTIVRHLVDLHRGTIDVHSEGRGRGATFVVTMPVAALAGTSPTPAVDASAPPATSRLNGVRVLVVDDDPNTLDLLTEALATTGARVTAADSARRALERLDAVEADVVVSDIAMPEEDGLWLIHRIRSLPGRLRSVPAVALSALARNADRAKAMEAGYQLYLTKPVQLSELEAGLAALLAERARGAGEEVG